VPNATTCAGPECRTVRTGRPGPGTSNAVVQQQAERADSEQVKAGRTQVLKGLTLYNVGLERFRKALTEALHTNGRGGVKKAKSALKTLDHAVRMVAKGARKIHG
jgi:hypothetical protein